MGRKLRTNKYLFSITEYIQDVINSYNTMIVLSDSNEEIIDVGSNTLVYENQDVLVFKAGRATITAENKVMVSIRCPKNKINGVNATIPVLKCGNKSMHMTEAVYGDGYICSIDLVNDNKDYILEDIRALLSCIV